MSELSPLLPPSAAVVTSFKSLANATSHAPDGGPAGSQANSFGPAVITHAPSLSGATLSAIKETSQEIEAPTPSLPSYDARGRSQGSNP